MALGSALSQALASLAASGHWLMLCELGLLFTRGGGVRVRVWVCAVLPTWAWVVVMQTAGSGATSSCSHTLPDTVARERELAYTY